MAVREHRGLTQRDLAAGAGVSEDLISLLENRSCRASKKTCHKLALPLACTTGDLLVVGSIA